MCEWKEMLREELKGFCRGSADKVVMVKGKDFIVVIQEKGSENWIVPDIGKKSYGYGKTIGEAVSNCPNGPKSYMNGID